MSTVLFDASQVKVMKMKESLLSDERFTLHPQAWFEADFVPAGNTDVEKKKSTEKFTKRLKALKKDMDDLSTVKAGLLGCLREFNCPFMLASNQVAYGYLAKLYATMEYYMKAYSKWFKAQKNNPELTELMSPFEQFFEESAFDMMKSDFEYLEEVVKQRMVVQAERFPDFKPRSLVSSSPDWEEVKVAYKAQLKSLKS